MLKGLKVIKAEEKSQAEPPKINEPIVPSDNHDQDNNKLLNKKRENIDSKKESFVSLDNFIAEKRKKEETLDFCKEFEKAFDFLKNGQNKELKDLYERLETYKNTRSNLKNIAKNILESVHEDRNSNSNSNIYKGVKDYHKIVNKDDPIELNTETQGNNFLDKEAYIIEDDKETQEEIETRYINTNLKNQVLKLQQFERFERQIPRKENEKIVETNKQSVEEKYIQKIEDKFNKNEEITEKKKQKKRMVILSSCNKCYGSQVYLSSLISQSDYAYIAYPYKEGSLSSMHLILSTKEHSNSMAGLEENVYIELRNYMKSIVSMNAKNDKMTIFLEHALHSDDISHFSIDCIPLKFSLLDDLRIFFKKALSEQDTEWSSNKKIIDTTKYKGNMTKILSDKFSYVHVDFNAQGGFLHVIDDERLFSNTFLKEILAPFLKKDISEIKYPKRLSQKELIEKVEEYKNEFDYYDWTKYNN